MHDLFILWLESLPLRVYIALGAVFITGLLGFVTGPLNGRSVPLYWIIYELLFAKLIEKINRPELTPQNEAFRGVLVLMLTLVLAVISAFTGYMAATINPIYGVSECILLCCCLSTGSLWQILFDMRATLEGKKKTGYYALAVSTNMDLNTTDDHGAAREGIILTYKMLIYAGIIPLVSYLIFGIAAAIYISFFAALFWCVANEGAKRPFTAVASRLFKVLTFWCAPVSWFCHFLASFLVPMLNPFRVLRGYFASPRARSFWGGALVNSMAHGAKISLGGAIKNKAGQRVERDWIGPKGATAKIDYSRLSMAIYAHMITLFVFMGMLIGILALYKHFIA